MTTQGRMPNVTIRGRASSPFAAVANAEALAFEQTRQRLAAVRVVVDDADRVQIPVIVFTGVGGEDMLDGACVVRKTTPDRLLDW